MCLIFISLNSHPDYKLIVAANRDEFYNRKTAPVQFWEDNKHVLGGRDLEAGGTWMGVTKKGNIAMVTNYRDPKNIKKNVPSRGHLVSDFLTGDQRSLSYLSQVAEKGKDYNGFNLIVGNQNELYYYSNYRDAISPIPPGVHGLSNHLLNTPWPKVRVGLQKFNSILSSDKVNADTLLTMLYDDERAPEDQLPDTGVGLEREKALSSMFIKSPGYGSRCSTVVLVDRANEVTFVERNYHLDTFEYTTQQFSFQIE